MQYNHEVIVPNEDLPFKMFLFEGKEGNYFRDRHWHRSIEIFAVFKGSLTFYLNDIEQQLHPGEFVIVNSNEIHAIDAPYPNQTVVIQMALNNGFPNSRAFAKAFQKKYGMLPSEYRKQDQK